MWGRDSNLRSEAKFVFGAQGGCGWKMQNRALSTSLCASKSYCHWTFPVSQRERSLQPGAGGFRCYLHTRIAQNSLPPPMRLFIPSWQMRTWSSSSCIIWYTETARPGLEWTVSDPLPTSLYFISLYFFSSVFVLCFSLYLFDQFSLPGWFSLLTVYSVVPHPPIILWLPGLILNTTRNVPSCRIIHYMLSLPHHSKSAL